MIVATEKCVFGDNYFSCRGTCFCLSDACLCLPFPCSFWMNNVQYLFTRLRLSKMFLSTNFFHVLDSWGGKVNVQKAIVQERVREKLYRHALADLLTFILTTRLKS